MKTIIRLITRSTRLNVLSLRSQPCQHYSITTRALPLWRCSRSNQAITLTSSFHSAIPKYAQSPTADALMDNINDLYATAKDEFEIAAEETERKTVYAEGDREAAREALTTLKEAIERAIRESDPEVAKDVKTRVGRKVQELENAIIAMEESAMED